MAQKMRSSLFIINIGSDFIHIEKNRWWYLTVTFFGRQNDAGQFHINCYAKKTLSAVCGHLNIDVVSIDQFQWKGER